LGVHFPTDIFGGYLLGFLLLLLLFWTVPHIESWLQKQKLSRQLILSLCLPSFLILLSPDNDPGCLTAAAVLLGCSSGIALERHWIGFRHTGNIWQRILRYLLGVVVLFALWIGLRVAFHNLEPDSLFRVIRYTLIGLWSSLGAPWIFTRLKLAEKEQRPKSAADEQRPAATK
jgi:hypothetical protein